MFRTIIIDDEIKAQNSLKKIIDEYCTDIEIIDTANNVSEGIKSIKTNKPQIVFLDIEMPDGTGFDVLKNIDLTNISVVFCTAHNDFAIKAFRYNAIDYILKPLDIDNVISATKKAIASLKLNEKDIAIKHLLSFYQNEDKKNEKIILKTASDIYVVEIKDIIHCESEGSYTTFYTENNKKITISKNLKEYETILKPHNFIRTHQSHLVNLNYIERLHKASGGYLVMKNGSQIPISTRKKESIIKAMENMHL